MKFKRIMASFLAGVFSLSMMHVNVSAQNSAEKASAEEKNIVVVVKEEEFKKESTAKKVLVKAADGTLYVAKLVGSGALSTLKTVGNCALFPIREFLKGVLVSTGVASVIAGLCVGCIYVVIKTNENVRKGGRNPFGYLYQELCEFKRSAVAERWEQECRVQ